MNGEPLELSGWFGPVGVLYNGGRFDHEFNLTWGDVQLQSAGSIEDVYAGEGANIRTTFNGPALENVSQRLDLPAVSHGPFNFDLSLDSTQDLTQLVMTGKLGTLDLIARGESDSITNPSTGFLDLDLEGGSLHRIGRLFDVEGLVDESFRLQMNADFKPGVIEFEVARLTTTQDHLSVHGAWHKPDHMAGTSLQFELQSPDIGRWAPAFGQPPMAMGSLKAGGRLEADETGVFSTVARLEQAPSTLEVEGKIGRLDQELTPDLHIRLESPNVRTLATLAGYPDFPAVPISLDGRVSRDGQALEIEDLNLDFNKDHARINGQVQLQQRLSGSDLEVALDIADLAALGALFGYQKLPAEPLKLTAELRPEGNGLKFEMENEGSQILRLQAEGYVPDLSKPMALDANYDIALPSLVLLQPLFPDLELPDLPASAAGGLHNDENETRLDQVRGSLGRLEATVDGSLFHDASYALTIRAQAPDASKLEYLAVNLPPVPLSFTGQVNGNPDVVKLPKFEAKLGDSQAVGELEVTLSEIPRITGVLKSENADLTHWSQVEQDEPDEPRGDRVFTDQPIFDLDQLGFELELELDAKRVQLANTQFMDMNLNASLSPQHARVDPFSFKPAAGLTGQRKVRTGPG